MHNFITDNDSAHMMSGGGGAKQGYMAMAIAYKQPQVICSADITGDTDQNIFHPMVEQLKDNLNTDLGSSKLLADAGFHTADNVDYCHREATELNRYLRVKHTLGLNWLSLRSRSKMKGQWLL